MHIFERHAMPINHNRTKATGKQSEAPERPICPIFEKFDINLAHREGGEVSLEQQRQ